MICEKCRGALDIFQTLLEIEDGQLPVACEFVVCHKCRRIEEITVDRYNVALHAVRVTVREAKPKAD